MEKEKKILLPVNYSLTRRMAFSIVAASFACGLTRKYCVIYMRFNELMISFTWILFPAWSKGGAFPSSHSGPLHHPTFSRTFEGSCPSQLLTQNWSDIYERLHLLYFRHSWIFLHLLLNSGF